MYVGQYLIIMFSALFSSFISILFGFYYLFKGFYLVKDSKNFKIIQRCFLTAFVYLVFIPLFVITLTHSILAPLISNVKIPSYTGGKIVFSGTEYVHQSNASDLYLMLFALSGITFWIYYQISNKKKI